jgi:hypothetical protein
LGIISYKFLASHWQQNYSILFNPMQKDCISMHFVCNMGLFEEFQRTICTRGITFTPEQMGIYLIKRIYNSVGDPNYINNDFAEQWLNNLIKQGEFCLLEVSNSPRLYKMSLITFEDIWSRNVFALLNKDYYDGFPDLITLYN